VLELAITVQNVLYQEDRCFWLISWVVTLWAGTPSLY
jgi:hypothetical protein